MNGRSSLRARIGRAAARVLGLALAATVWLAGAAAQRPDESGTQADAPTVVSIVVEGQRRYAADRLRDALGQRIGVALDEDAIQRGLAILWDAFKVKGTVQRRPVPGGIELRLEVLEMNVDLEPRFAGNNDIPVETLRQWALLEERGELFLHQAERVRQRLLEGYRRKGYAFAEVDVVKRGSESGPADERELPDVIFEIREGPKVRVKGYYVRGNDAMPERGVLFWKDGLMKLADVELDAPWLLSPWGDEFVREKLDADLLAMREVYRDRGYLDAVVEVESLDYTPDRSGVFIHVVVDEGPIYLVSSLSIEGVTHTWDPARREYDDAPAPLLFPADELRALCKLEVGKRYDRTRVRADSAALKQYYGDRGYLSHPSLVSEYFEFLEPTYAFDPERHQVAVTYRLAQGRKRWIREVLFDGAQHTRDRVVRREVDMLPGEQADLSKIRRSLSRIYSTRFFTVQIPTLDHHDPTFAFKPTEDPNWVDLQYSVDEGSVVNINLQGGVDSNNGLFGRLSISMGNFDVSDTPSSFWSLFDDILDKEAFHGAGQQLDLELSPGTVVNSYRVRFLEPDLFRTHFDRYSLELELFRRDRTQRFFDEDRNEKRIRIGRDFGRDFTIYGGYTNQNVRVTDLTSTLDGIVDPDARPLPDSIYQQEGTSNLAGATLDFQYRHVDQTLNTREGFQATWRNSIFGGPIGGDYDFWKSQVDFDFFWLTPGDEDQARPGWHLSLSAGVADTYGETDDTPYTERFFLGGNRTLRGFSYRGVGPNKGRNALGGESLLNGSLEYRIPIYTVVQPGTYRNVEQFRLTLFTDAGILDEDPFRADLSEARWSVGFGLGMVQPIPVTLNFGFPLTTGDGDRRQTFSFSILSLGF